MRDRRRTEGLGLLAASLALVLAIPLSWGHARALDGELALSGVEVPLFGWTAAFVAGVLTACWLTHRARPGVVAPLVALFVALATSVFAVTLLATTSLLTEIARLAELAELVGADNESVSAEPGIGLGVVLVAGLVGAAGATRCALSAPTRRERAGLAPGERPVTVGGRWWWAHATAQLPAALWRTTTAHYRDARHAPRDDLRTGEDGGADPIAPPPPPEDLG
ncbi:MAG: hypothetical protein U5R31_05025 [Acidimicrobiia bacterium]|nr:hypothetical protein [Acidimicrobiia bacterium]